MKAMLMVLFVGAAVSAATALFPAEGVQAFTPFAVLSTIMLLVAYWAVWSDHTPAAHRASTPKRAA